MSHEGLSHRQSETLKCGLLTIEIPYVDGLMQTIDDIEIIKDGLTICDETSGLNKIAGVKTSRFDIWPKDPIHKEMIRAHILMHSDSSITIDEHLSSLLNQLSEQGYGDTILSSSCSNLAGHISMQLSEDTPPALLDIRHVRRLLPNSGLRLDIRSELVPQSLKNYTHVRNMLELWGDVHTLLPSTAVDEECDDTVTVRLPYFGITNNGLDVALVLSEQEAENERVVQEAKINKTFDYDTYPTLDFSHINVERIAETLNGGDEITLRLALAALLNKHRRFGGIKITETDLVNSIWSIRYNMDSYDETAN